MSVSKQLEVILYTRQGCHLCDESHDLLRRYGIHPHLVDIDGDEQLQQRYTECVPVVVISGKERFRGRINEVLLRRLLNSEPSSEPGKRGASKLAGRGEPGKDRPVVRPGSGPASWLCGKLRWLCSPRKSKPEEENVANRQRTIRSLGIMAKYWEPGRCKTRLGETIGDAEAAELSRCFLIHLLHRFRNGADSRTLVFSPDERQAEFESLCQDPSIGGGAWSCEPQGSGNLGERMERFVRRARKRGAGKVILIGSDMPTIARERIDEAWETLDSYPVVLGPAEDGGYYLIGIAGDPPPIFAGVPWGTPQVLPWTRHLLDQRGLAYHQLAMGYDVDRHEDLVRLSQELARRESQSGSANAELLASIQVALDSNA